MARTGGSAWLNPSSSAKLVKEVLEMDAAIKKADEQIAFVLQNKEALRAYEMRQLALWDYASTVGLAREEGLEEGKAEGRKEGKEETIRDLARNLKALGDPLDKIAQVTGLSPDQIKDL
jgi:predicted transposase/invertase (TIGR01784 family)